MQSVIDLARLDLNDSDKVRHTDADCLKFLNDYIQEAISKRPDLFFGVASSLPNNLALNADFPMNDRYVRGAADFVIARCNMRGTEEGRLDVGSAYLQLSAANGGA